MRLFAQYFSVNVKRAKGNKTGQQYFQGGVSELPLLFYTYVQRVKDKKQKQDSVYGANRFDHCRVSVEMFGRNGNSHQNQQRNSFEETDDSQSPKGGSE